MTLLRFVPAAAVLAAAAVAHAADPPDPAVARILAVGREGTGNSEAAAAWRDLVGRGPNAVFAALPHLDPDRPAASNWLRLAVQTVAEKERAAGRQLPADKLEAFVRDTGRSPDGRALAFTLLAKIDPAAPGRLLPAMLDDPSGGLRREAVASAIEKAQKDLDAGKKDEATAAFRTLFDKARDKDQVDDLAARLKKLGVETDVVGHYGFLTRWWVIGPFDNVGGKGFATAYPPETKVDLAAKPIGKDGKTELAWKPHTSAAPLGVIDLNKAVSKHMGAVGYAYTEIESPAERRVEFRIGTGGAVKVFLNGKLTFASPVYHNGHKMDQYTAPVTLAKGRNALLVKVCQNEQTDSWAQDWEFQLRVCDAIGGAVPLAVATPPADAAKAAAGGN
jgi:hypothetical protein